MDWPNLNTYYQPSANLCPLSAVVLESLFGAGSTATASAVWPVANRAMFYPVCVQEEVTINAIGFIVGTQNGNVDVGVYNAAGTRLVSAGTTAVAAAGPQLISLTATVLPPGPYYMAMACSSITAAFWRISTTLAQDARMCGMQQQASSVPLPATATFATIASGYIPLMVGLTNGLGVF